MKIFAIRNYPLTTKFQQKNNINFIKLNVLNADTISFCAKAKNVVIPNSDIKQEVKKAEFAKSLGISTPKIKRDGTYQIKGNNADYLPSPITHAHLRNIFKNIQIMDENGIYHGDIEKEHLLYRRGGKVEFDCFRYGKIKSQDGEKYAERIAELIPNNNGSANLYDFENHSLGEYLRTIANPEKEKEFIKDYLTQSVIFHAKAAENPEISNSHFEELQVKMYENPDEDIVDLVRDRINFKHTERLAFTSWDEGNGACGYALDEGKMLLGVNLYFRAWSDSLQYLQKIEEVKQRTQDKEKLELLNYFEEYALHTEKQYRNNIIGMATWRLSPENPNNRLFRDVDGNKIKEFEEQYSEIKDIENLKLKRNKLALIKKFYNNIN